MVSVLPDGRSGPRLNANKINNFGWKTDNMWAVSTCYDKLNGQNVNRAEACFAAETLSVAQTAAQATSTAEVGIRSAAALYQEAALVPYPSSETFPLPRTRRTRRAALKMS